MIIAIEGGEGAGKTTVAKALADSLWTSHYYKFPSNYIREEFLAGDLFPSQAQAMTFADIGIHYLAIASLGKNCMHHAILDRSWISDMVYRAAEEMDGHCHQANVRDIKLHLAKSLSLLKRTFPDIFKQKILYVFLDVDAQTGLTREENPARFSDQKFAKNVNFIYRVLFTYTTVWSGPNIRMKRFWTGETHPQIETSLTTEQIIGKIALYLPCFLGARTYTHQSSSDGKEEKAESKPSAQETDQICEIVTTTRRTQG